MVVVITQGPHRRCYLFNVRRSAGSGNGREAFRRGNFIWIIYIENNDGFREEVLHAGGCCGTGF